MSSVPKVGPYVDFFDMDALFSEEQRLTRDSVREFVQAKAAPLIQECFRKETFPEELIPQFGEMGLLGSNLSGYGLAGLDAVSYGLIMRELERCDSGLRSFASVQGALVMFPIHAYGSEAQKKEWLPKLASGQSVGCFGLTESEGGSDPGAMRTHAEFRDGKWILNGSKMWITNGNLSEIAVIWAQTEQGIRGFIVPTKQDGVRVVKMKDKLSLRASITSELYFDQVALPEPAILPEAKGLKAPLSCLSQARYGISWGVLGAAEACYDEVSAYVKERVLFGKPLASKQLVQAKLARMLSQITQGQLLVHRLAGLKDSGEIHFSHISLAKQNNCEMALDVAREARDMLGANGIMDEYQSIRHMLNLETVKTYEGTNDIHLLILGSTITGLASY